jgi:hypothetical protein
MFVIGAAIKLVAFKSPTVWFEVQPAAALWATGILFTLAVSERTYFRARLVTQVSKKSSGSGVDVNYVVEIPDDLAFSSKMIYLFVGGVAIWILTILLSGYAYAAYSSLQGFSIGFVAAIFLSVLLASTVVITAVLTLNDTTK